MGEVNLCPLALQKKLISCKNNVLIMYSITVLILRAKLVVTVWILLLSLPQDYLALSASQTYILRLLVGGIGNGKRI